MNRPIDFGSPEFKRLLKTGLFTGSVVLAVGILGFTYHLIGRLSHEVSTTSRVLARFCAQASFPATRDPELQQIFSEVLAGIDFPLVITDTGDLPRAWRHVGVDPALVPSESIDSLEARMPISPAIRARIEAVRARVLELDRKNPPIPMTMTGGFPLGAVHFGEPPVLALLRWVPWVSLAGVGVLTGLGLWGLALVRAADRRTIWVGMAKETAHQLGTPLSSLLGWIQLLREQPETLGETVGEMERDVQRLEQVARRFSRVGSAPELIEGDVEPVVRDVVEYMRKRLPQRTQSVTLNERYAPVPAVRYSRDLVEWAVENLIANAISALDGKPGTIEVALEPAPEGGAVDVIVRDDGRGMSPAEQQRAFTPGYTTKRRGWGLGLPLTRRIVEEYHRGRVFVRDSAPGKGTTMVMRLPA